MDFLIQLFTTDSVAHTFLILTVIAALGLTLGSLRIFNIQLGVAGVLFAGLLFGHFKFSFNPEILDFVREFGLLLFVYTIGMQVGPGFFSSLKRDGLRLNMLAAFIVLAGAAIALGLHFFAGIPLPAAVGLFSGATTNTPSLAAAQQALKEIPSVTPEMLTIPGMAYAMAYPFGILGIIFTMIITRIVFRVQPAKEAEQYTQTHAKNVTALEVVDLKVENPNLNGLAIKKVPSARESGIAITRVMHEGKVQIALPDVKIFSGDVIRAVGPHNQLEAFKLIVGQVSKIDLEDAPSDITSRRVIITRRSIVGHTLEELHAHLYGVTISRIGRADLDFPVTPTLELNFADTLMVVGDEPSIQKFSSVVGDSPKRLDHPQLIPIFVGLALGVILGSWPIKFAGMPAPVKLGLAGGPLVIAILLSRIGRIGKLIWYMPVSANFMLREIGITLFLACVGLRSGDRFVETILLGDGLYWMLMATLITLIPILIVAAWARLKYKMNYLTICGLVAGSMTDPPALAYANQMSASSAQIVAYASVYPLVMLLRVIAAQVLVIFFMR